LVVGEDVSVGVPGDERDVIEAAEHLEYLGRVRTEEDEVTERPPSVDPETTSVVEDHLQRVGNTVYVSDDPQSHRATVHASSRFRPGDRRPSGASKHRVGGSIAESPLA
jgi:hypothetical protein